MRRLRCRAATIPTASPRSSPRRFAGRGRRHGGAPRAGRPLPRPAGRSRRGLCREPGRHPGGPAKTDGIAAGEQVGAGFLDLPAIEGLNDTVPYVQPPPGPGVYEPTASATPLGTKLPLVVPLALEAASQFRPDGPLPLSSRRVRSRPQAGEEAGPPGQHGPDGGTDAHRPLLDRPRHPAVESQPGSPGRAARPGPGADGPHAGHGARRGIRRDDRLLRRQVSLSVLASAARDPARRYRRQPPDPAGSHLAAPAPHAQSPRVPVRACLPHHGDHGGPGGVLRHPAPSPSRSTAW